MHEVTHVYMIVQNVARNVVPGKAAPMKGLTRSQWEDKG